MLQSARDLQGTLVVPSHPIIIEIEDFLNLARLLYMRFIIFHIQGLRVCPSYQSPLSLLANHLLHLCHLSQGVGECPVRY